MKAPKISAWHELTCFQIDLVIFFFFLKYRFKFQPSLVSPFKIYIYSHSKPSATLIGLGKDQVNHLAKCVNLQK